MNFGTNSASELFQHIISKQINDIPGTLNISDDVIVFGKTREAHDTALEAIFRRFSDKGLTVNKEKCEFHKSSITFFGFVFSAEGISPDPKKVQAIHEAQPPCSATGVRSFLGMVMYCAKFIPKFSDVTQPLRRLTEKNVQFKWTEKEAKAFETVKQLLTSSTVMAYFDKNKETEVITDASPWGLSAILSQHTPGKGDRRIVAYVSRSLSPVEQRYSQTEREALAIVWAVERLHIYLYGEHFTVYTDCKPVQLILSNRKSKPPARIERWNLRLQEYDFSIVHTKGTDNPSDFMSRHPSMDRDATEKQAEEYVHFISTHAVPKAMSLQEIQRSTKADPTLQKLAEFIHSDNWDSLSKPPASEFEEGVNVAELKSFKKIKEEITTNEDDSVLLRGTRIIVPFQLRRQAISLAHEGHQGLVKTKQLLREKIWFPGIDEQVTVMIKNCLACQANTPANRPDPLKMSPLPPEPWHTIHIDFCGPFPTGG